MNPEKITADEFYAVIEIEKGGKNKYELDKDTGMLKLDRVLYTSLSGKLRLYSAHVGGR